MYTPYCLTAPVGHAGAPYRESSERSREPHSVSSILPFVSSGRDILTAQGLALQDNHYTYGGSRRTESLEGTSPTLFSRLQRPQSYIDKLPFEVRFHIANRLSQYDAVSLLRVNKAFFASTVARLYHTVIVNPSFSHFNEEVFEQDEATTVDVYTSTFVKLRYSLKHFLKTIGQEIPFTVGQEATRPHYSTFINELRFVELPDGFYTPFDLNFFTFMSVKKLDHITRFYWESEKELQLEILSRIPNKHRLMELSLNVDFKRVASPSDFTPFREFTNLHVLSIEPFLNAFNLFQIFKNLLEGNNDFLNLRVLRLARFNSNHGFLKNPATQVLVLTNYIIEHDRIKISEFELNCILNLFILFSAAESQLNELKMLSLDSMVITTADAQRMASFINLKGVEFLELKNISEIQLPEDIDSPLSLNELYTKLDTGFLRSFGKHLKGLKKLSIDYRESLRDSIPAFIHSLDGLEELDVTIRWNVTKLCSVASWKHLCHHYIKAILKHSSTLKKLSLDTKEDSVFSDFHKLIFPECLMELSQMKSLEALRLHGYSLQPCAPALASTLPNLKYFELFGSGAGGAPHMALQVVHDGVLDDWLRVQHVALAISAENRGIRFIKVDKCIFEIKGPGVVVPRDGLESWFAFKVRVMLNTKDAME